MVENHPEQAWAPSFIKLMLDMKRAKNEAVDSRREWLDAKRNEFSRRYGQIIRRSYQENPPPSASIKRRGRRKRGRVLALIDRLKKRKASVCLFIEKFAIPFDNNEAERDLRMVKVKAKVSGCFRSDQGLVIFFVSCPTLAQRKSRM